jgi:glycosyltransferase involved in cell wall biosynthesis
MAAEGAALKVTFVIPYFYPAWQYGGQPRAAYELARSLARRGHSITVLTTDSGGATRLTTQETGPKGRRKVDGVDIIYYRNVSNALAFRQRIFCSPAFWRDVKSRLEDTDILHIHELRSTMSVGAYRAAQSLRLPYVLSTHGGLRHLGRKGIKVIFDRLWGNSILQGAAAVISISPVEQKDARRYGVRADRIEQLPNGLAVEDYKDLPAKGSLRQRWSIHEAKIILFLGRLHWIKGPDLLLDAFHRLIQTHRDAHLVIAGPDDGQERELRNRVSELKMEGRVTFTGFCDQRCKLEAFADAEVAVIPSRSEVFAITAIEALASECPVLLSDICGLYPSPTASQGALHFKSENVDDLAEKLDAVIKDPSIRSAAKDGRRFVEAEFSNQRVGESAERIYRRVLQRGMR